MHDYLVGRSAGRRQSCIAPRRRTDVRLSRALRVSRLQDVSSRPTAHADRRERAGRRRLGAAVVIVRSDETAAGHAARRGSPARSCCRRSCRSPSRWARRPKVGRTYTLPMLRSRRDGAEATCTIACRSRDRVRGSGQRACSTTRVALDGARAATRCVPGASRPTATRRRGSAAWVDEQGRVVLRRSCSASRSSARPYEVAFENWRPTRQARRAGRRRTATSRDDGDRGEQARSQREPRRSSRVRLTGVDLDGLRRSTAVPAAAARRHADDHARAPARAGAGKYALPMPRAMRCRSARAVDPSR